MLRYPDTTVKNGYRVSPTGRTLWCGPFMVAQVTGLSYDDAYAKCLSWLRRARMKWLKRHPTYRHQSDYRLRKLLPKVVKGTYEEDITKILDSLGVTNKLVYSKTTYGKTGNGWPTLITFVRDHTIKGHTYIVVAGHHWVTIKDGILYHSHHAPCPIEEAKRYRMARVECWADVKPRPAALLPNNELQPVTEAA